MSRDFRPGLITGAMARFKPTVPPKPMPDLEFLDADDKPLRLADLTGKARLINLWATWCAPCVKEMPSLDRLQAALPRDKFIVLPISLDGPSKAKVAPFYKKQGLTNLGIFYDKGRKAMSVARRVAAADLDPGRSGRPRARPAGGRRRLGHARGHRAHEGGHRQP